jgi:hypothetical protein
MNYIYKFILPFFKKCIGEVEDLHETYEGQVGRIKEISFKTMKVTKKIRIFHNLTRGQIVNVDSLLHTCV